MNSITKRALMTGAVAGALIFGAVRALDEQRVERHLPDRDPPCCVARAELVLFATREESHPPPLIERPQLALIRRGQGRRLIAEEALVDVIAFDHRDHSADRLLPHERDCCICKQEHP